MASSSRSPCRSTSGFGRSSLGIEYPRIVESGLAEHEKRIFVAELNAARRQLTDAQKVALGKRIEPDIAKRARLRQEELGRSQGKDPLGSSDPKGRTRDEVARTVQLGSGITYERGRQVLDALEEEPDGPQLMQHIEAGDWDEVSSGDAGSLPGNINPVVTKPLIPRGV